MVLHILFERLLEHQMLFVINGPWDHTATVVAVVE
jgi:hypothetical protein